MSSHVSAARLAAFGLFTFAIVQLQPACDRSDDGGSGTGASEGGASADDQQRCKSACNQLKFFDCNDAADHAACFLSCESAPASAIEVFVACVEADICDPQCAANLEGQAGGEGGGEGEGGEGGEGSEGGNPTSSCPDACAEYVAAGCFPDVDCASACASLTELEQAFVGYCVDRRMGCELPEECADALPGGDEGSISEEEGTPEGGEITGAGEVGGPDPVVECQDACDTMEFFDCIDAAQHADCRELCTTASTDAIATFTACASGCQDDSCYQVLAGAP